MMGHKVDTYHDIQMKGAEFLRGIYSASGLGIRAKTQLSKIDMAKQVLAAVAGVRPEEIIIREAQAHPHRSYASPDTQSRSPHEFNQRRRQERHNPLSIDSHS